MLNNKPVQPSVSEYGAAGTTLKTPTRHQVPEGLDALAARITEAEERAAQLRERLYSVLRPAIEQAHPEEGAGLVGPALAPVAVDIASLIGRMDVVLAILRDTQARLEV